MRERTRLEASLDEVDSFEREFADNLELLELAESEDDADVAGETLQAVRTHAYASVLDAPGKTDLTAHVNFAELARAAKSAGGATYGPVTQERFLMALGIEARAKQLFEQATVEQRADIKSAFKRLTAPEAMGRLFKVMAIGVPDKQPPPGFEN